MDWTWVAQLEGVADGDTVTTGYDTYWVHPYCGAWFRIYEALFGLASAFRIRIPYW